MFQGVVGAVGFAQFDLADFFADSDHGVAEAIDFGLALRFRRLKHQRTGDRPGHRGGVEAIVHEAFGDVFDFHTGGFFRIGGNRG